MLHWKRPICIPTKFTTVPKLRGIGARVNSHAPVLSKRKKFDHLETEWSTTNRNGLALCFKLQFRCHRWSHFRLRGIILTFRGLLKSLPQKLMHEIKVFVLLCNTQRFTFFPPYFTNNFNIQSLAQIFDIGFLTII